MRFPVTLLLSLLLSLLQSVLLGPAAPPPVTAAARVPAAAASSRSDLVAALEVLRGWDARRAQAWSHTDRAALRALYLPGSTVGRADVRLLGAYQARGIVVRRLVTQVFAVKVLHRDPTTVRVRVFDRVAGGELLRDGLVAPLRSSRPVTRTVELRREGAGWQVAAVSGSVPDPRATRR